MPMHALKHPSHHRSWVEIDLGAIRYNMRRFHELVGPDVQIMPSVKANAYGHGAAVVAPVFVQEGAERLLVATLQEAQQIRDIGARLHLIGAPLPEEIPAAVEMGLCLSIHEPDIARLISLEAVHQNRVAVVHLKIDTGMGRLGVLPEEVAEVAAFLHGLPGIELEGVFMHFADASDEAYSLLQLQRFKQAISILEEEGIHVPVRHASSSASAVLYPESHFDIIRPGAGLYGYQSPGWLRQRFPLRPVMSWKCIVVQVKDYPEGSHLGYNRTFTTRRPTKVAVLPVGYADGYVREFSNRAQVLIRGRRAPIVGMISMDYAMADVTEFDDVTIGSEVTLLGKDGNDEITAEELSEHAGTIPYVVTTCIGHRIGRSVIDSDPDQPSSESPTTRR